MKKMILLVLVCLDFLVPLPLNVNALDPPEVSLNLEQKPNVLPTQSHLPYQIGYTVHYRSLRDRKWTLEGFHLKRRDADRAARRLRRLGFRSEVRWRSLSERESRARAELRGDR